MILAIVQAIEIVGLLAMLATAVVWVFVTFMSIVASAGNGWRALRGGNRVALAVSISLVIWASPLLLCAVWSGVHWLAR